jgi:hypothetical protein
MPSGRHNVISTGSPITYGQCDLGLTTFQDDPNNKTYCLSDPMLGNG